MRRRVLARAAIIGLVFGLLYGLYAFLRLPHVTVTSKTLGFDPLFLVGRWRLPEISG